jgi:hypothetical protein
MLAFNCLSLLGRGSVQLGAVHTGVVSPHSTKSPSQRTVAAAGTLDCERLAHDRAATAENLEIGHATSARRNIVASGGRGERTKSGGRCFREERAHRPRLAQNGLHVGQWRG